jgi:hypothetical protein
MGPMLIKLWLKTQIFFFFLCLDGLGFVACSRSELINSEMWTLQIVGGTPWTGDQPVAKPLPTQDNINADIYASSEIRTHDLSVLAGEDLSCLRTRSHCDWQTQILSPVYTVYTSFNRHIKHASTKRSVTTRSTSPSQILFVHNSGHTFTQNFPKMNL